MDLRKKILIMFFLSGVCGLIYEVIWVRMLTLIFGNTTYAVSTVLAAFMAGLALGSWYFGKFIDTQSSIPDARKNQHPASSIQHPLKVFAFLMLGIGIYCVLTPFLFKLIELVYIALASSFTPYALHITRFILGFIVILIPTALMGGTLPVLSKFFVGQGFSLAKSKPKGLPYDNMGSNIGVLYSVNTWGAVLGSFACGFILIMLLGVKGTLYLASGVNLIIAGIVFILSRNVAVRFIAQKESDESDRYSSPLSTFNSQIILLAIALSGFTALAYEIVWTRVLSMVLGSSVYAFATMLCAFLGGIALGSMIYARLSKNVAVRFIAQKESDKSDRYNLINRPTTLFGFIQAGIGISVLLLIPIFGVLPFLFLKLFKICGTNFVGFQFVQFLLVFGVMLIPTTLFGATIPLACKIYSQNVRRGFSLAKSNPKGLPYKRMNHVGSAVGNVYAANTIGAILGSMLAGFALIPLIGLQRTITMVALINVGLAIILINFTPMVAAGFSLRNKKRNLKVAATEMLRGRKWVRGLITCFLVFFTVPYVLALPSWNKKVISSGIYQYAPDYLRESSINPKKEGEIWKRRMDGKEILFYKEGVHFTVCVQKHQNGITALSIDGKTDASNNFQGDMITQLLSAHLPILLYSCDTESVIASPDLSGRGNLKIASAEFILNEVNVPRNDITSVITPRSVLIIGLASGVTLGAVTQWKDIEEIDCVEIEPAMIEASHYFDEWNNEPLKDKRVKIITNDARNYLLTTKKKYDIIISEPSNPWISGCAALFTKEYYGLARSRLKEGGIFCGWMQIYKMEPQDYKTIINTVKSVFPHISIWNASSGDTLILSTPEKLSINYQELKKKFMVAKPDLEKIYLSTPLNLLTKFIMVPDFKQTELNTDNHPSIEFSAGRNLYNSQVSGKTYRMLLEKAEPILGYLTDFEDYTDLIKTYLDKGVYIPLEKMVTSISSKNSAEYYNLLGFVYLKQRKYQEATEALDKAILRDKRYVDAYVNKAEVYLKQKDYKKAFNFINKALEIKSDYAPNYNIKGLIYLAQGKYNQALKDFEKAQKLSSTLLEAYINQAVVYLNYMDIPPAALFILKDAVNVNPRSSEVYYYLGITLFRLKDYRQAAEMFSTAIFYNPDYEDIVRKTLIRLQRKG